MHFNPTAFSEQDGGTKMDDHGGNSSNMIMYNMNLMGGVGPMYSLFVFSI